MRKLILGAMLGAMATPVMASNWFTFSTIKDGTTDALETETISKGGDYRTAWVKTDFVNNPNKISQQRMLTYYNCSNRTFAVKSLLTYYTSGQNKVENFEVLNFMPEAPDTIGEKGYTLVCGLDLSKR